MSNVYSTISNVDCGKSMSSAALPSPTELRRIPIDQITIPGKWRAIDKKVIDDLAESIDQMGLMQPILVSLDSKGVATLIAGRHRLEAFRKRMAEYKGPTDAAKQSDDDKAYIAQWSQINAIVYNGDNESEDTHFFRNTDENLMRKDLTATERAKLVKLRLSKMAERVKKAEDTRTAQQKAKAAQHQASKSKEGSGDTSSPKGAATTPPPKVQDLVSKVSEAANCSPATAKRKIAEARKEVNVPPAKGGYAQKDAAKILDTIGTQEVEKAKAQEAPKKKAPAKAAAGTGPASKPDPKLQPSIDCREALVKAGFTAAKAKRLTDEAEAILTILARPKTFQPIFKRFIDAIDVAKDDVKKK